MIYDFLGVLATTPRVGQNAVLGSMRHGFPGAGEYGAAYPIDGVVIYAKGLPHKWEPARTTRFVRIWRRDTIAQAVSWAMAAQNGRFHSHQELTGEAVYDRDDITSALNAIRDGDRAWKADLLRRKVTLTLCYEDHIRDDPQPAAQAIFDSWEMPLTAGPTDIHPTESELKLEWIERYKAGR
jgi:LPS sulfotransferase NodH